MTIQQTIEIIDDDHYYYLNDNHSQTYGFGKWKWHIEAGGARTWISKKPEEPMPMKQHVVFDVQHIMIHRETSSNLYENENISLGKLMYDVGSKLLQEQAEKIEVANMSQRDYLAKEKCNRKQMESFGL